MTLQLYDAAGVRVAQGDIPLTDDGGLGIAAWAPGAATRTRQRLDLPPGLPPGTYRLRIGLYRLDEGHVDRFAPAPSAGWPAVEGEDVVVEVAVGAAP